MVWGHRGWAPHHPAAMALGAEPEASSGVASPTPTTYPSSAARWLWAPPAARRAGPPSPRSPCWAAAPPARAMSSRHPGPPCACPALREPAQQSLGGSGQWVPLPRSCPSSLGPPAEGQQALGQAPTCNGHPGEPVASSTTDGLPGQQHALRRDVVDSQVLHTHRAPCGREVPVTSPTRERGRGQREAPSPANPPALAGGSPLAPAYGC